MQKSLYNFNWFTFALLATGLFLVAPTHLEAQEETQDQIRVLIFGDSITAGYGVGKSEAFPAELQEIADSLGYDNVEFINGGLSGETSAGGLRRVDWMLRQPVDVFVLELGGNDGLRGLDLSATKQNLNDILAKVEAKYPNAVQVVAGMQVPPNLGDEYTTEFRGLFKEVADANDAMLIPFLLEGVGGLEKFNQNDGIHPNEAGHEKVAEHIWPYLKEAIEKVREREAAQ